MAKHPASTSPFAHLAAANAESEDDDKNKSKAKAAGEEEEEGEEEADDEKGTRAKRSKAKKAKAEGEGEADDGDTDDEEDEKDDQAKAARSRERARCAAIFASPAAARNLPGAAHLAFNTALPRSQAVGLLDSLTPTAATPARSAKTESQTLRDRMQASPFGGVKPEDTGANAPANPGARLVAAQAIRKGGK
ncbi:hypothetical protein FOH24_07055 [Acetobacter tropicalis]|uniref:Uncharacterized protein n=1 Tax=Acetobacter tropicalis TaxID=104102 RepID=A0A094YIJ2_9PROT|nr:hypothetical protein [Acetobacter tropicalis]KAA8387046.1 hypothetical protein FOH22_10400 [Acetobacter tropicalis]KAA8391391.1 hypothetical protein FOH24_07055 [Acetobacter tropicalis]KGB21162.1 hypothetical protein AtDm6_3157 [Acetobacter tropicalis]MBC9008785.1 hypothetical protein [Acetobacter tropicalis]MDO8171958.1 hypothetical protein [Acetobacter tropicalis]